MRARQPDEGLKAIDEAMAFCEQSGETFFEAELRRLRGELLLWSPEPDLERVERSFLDAIAIARRQETRWLELRAAISLARVWRDRKPAEARIILGRACGWFTEGADTADLEEANILLHRLRRPE
jgi:predicted ATPase